MVSNPSKVLEEDRIAKYATNKLQRDYERAHPEDMKEIKNNDLHSLIDLIEKTGKSEFLKGFHDIVCLDCTKKNGCTIYSILDEKYQHRHRRF